MRCIEVLLCAAGGGRRWEWSVWSADVDDARWGCVEESVCEVYRAKELWGRCGGGSCEGGDGWIDWGVLRSIEAGVWVAESAEVLRSAVRALRMELGEWEWCEETCVAGLVGLLRCVRLGECGEGGVLKLVRGWERLWGACCVMRGGVEEGGGLWLSLSEELLPWAAWWGRRYGGGCTREMESDAVQDGILKGFGALQSGDFCAVAARGLDGVGSWFRALVEGQLRSAVRRLQRESARSEEFVVGEEGTLCGVAASEGEEECVGGGWLDDVRVGLEVMSRSKGRLDGVELLESRLLEGESVAQLAERWGCSVAAMEQRVYRACVWLMDAWLEDDRCFERVDVLGGGDRWMGVLGVLLRVFRARLRSPSVWVVRRRVLEIGLRGELREVVERILMKWWELEKSVGVYGGGWFRAFLRGYTKICSQAERGVLSVFVGEYQAGGRVRRSFGDFGAFALEWRRSGGGLVDVARVLGGCWDAWRGWLQVRLQRARMKKRRVWKERFMRRVVGSFGSPVPPSHVAVWPVGVFGVGRAPPLSRPRAPN